MRLLRKGCKEKRKKNVGRENILGSSQCLKWKMRLRRFTGIGQPFEDSIGEEELFYPSKFFCGEGNDNPLQYSCLENPMDGGAW